MRVQAYVYVKSVHNTIYIKPRRVIHAFQVKMFWCDMNGPISMQIENLPIGIINVSIGIIERLGESIWSLFI